MISIIKGTIESVDKDALVVMTESGVGYEVRVEMGKGKWPACAGREKGEKVKLFTYLKVSDSAMDLYGFALPEEREFFELLMTVSGVGPKSAMHIMSAGSLADVQAAIARGDAAHLSQVQGIGKKTAERLVVELRSKMQNAVYPDQSVGDCRMQNVAGGANSETLGEVIEALVGMGYAREEARAAVLRLEGTGKTTEELLKLALQEVR